MLVYVTGASGFVGQRLLPTLEAAGHATVGVDRNVDVTSRLAVEESLRAHRPDAIIHLAAMSSVAESARHPETCFLVNFAGTRNVLESAVSVCPDARVLLVGSTDQFVSAEPLEQGFDETTPLKPRSAYGRSKAAAEMLGQEAAAAGQDVVRVRASNHSGPGQLDEFVVSSFARQVAAIHRGRRDARMRVGNLASVRDFLHVDDVVDAYLALLDRAVAADVYHVSSGRGIEIREILDHLIEIAEIDPVVDVDPDRWRPTDWCVADASKLRAATQWNPRIPLDTMLRQLYEDWLTRDAAP
jgi:GDP-4-dehydro-6-deoxy-D-mannose reductase